VYRLILRFCLLWTAKRCHCDSDNSDRLPLVNLHLQAQGVRITTGTIVDATILHAPTSTKNREQQRDPEMHQTKKGKPWYFGM